MVRLRIALEVTVSEAEWREGKLRHGDEWELGTHNEAFLVAVFGARDALQAYAQSANVDAKVIK